MKHVLGTNEHFTISKGGTEQNVDDLLAQIPALQQSVLAMQDSVSELAVGIGGLSVKANEWVGVGTWGDTLSWPAGNVWPSGN